MIRVLQHAKISHDAPHKHCCVLLYPSCCYYGDPPDDFPPDGDQHQGDQHQGEHHRDHLLLHPDSVSSEAPQNLSNGKF